MDDTEEDDLALRAGDYVVLKGSEEMGRIVGPGKAPRTWVVRFYATGENKEIEEDRLEPTYRRIVRTAMVQSL